MGETVDKPSENVQHSLVATWVIYIELTQLLDSLFWLFEFAPECRLLLNAR